MGSKSPLLGVFWSIIVMIIQAGFPNGHNLRMPGKADQIVNRYIQLLMGVVRVGPHRAIYVLIGFRHLKDFMKLLYTGANRHQTTNA